MSFTELEALHIDSVEILGALDCSPEQKAALSNKIRLYRKGWPRYPLVRTGLQVHEGVGRHVDFFIAPGSQSNNRHSFRLEVRPASLDQETTKARETSINEFHQLLDVLECIQSLEIECRAHAHVNWEYEPGSYETLIELPMLTTMGDEMPFDYVSGLRFVKESQVGRTAVILDTMRNGVLLASAQIPLENPKPSLDLLDHVTHDAVSLIEKYVNVRLAEQIER